MDVEVQDRDFIQSLARGLEVLEAFSGPEGRLSLTDVARRTGLSRGTARRFLITLVRLDHLATDGRHYWLTGRVLRFGHAYLTNLPWWRIAQPVIGKAAETLQIGCIISVLSGSDVTFVMSIGSQQTLAEDPIYGSRMPAHATAAGRVLLAALSNPELDDYFKNTRLTQLTPKTIVDRYKLESILDDVRARGYCMIDGEVQLDVRSISVPLVGRSGQVLAAISFYTGDPNRSLEDEFLPVLKQAQITIQKQMTSPITPQGNR